MGAQCAWSASATLRTIAGPKRRSSRHAPLNPLFAGMAKRDAAIALERNYT